MRTLAFRSEKALPLHFVNHTMFGCKKICAFWNSEFEPSPSQLSFKILVTIYHGLISCRNNRQGSQRGIVYKHVCLNKTCKTNLETSERSLPHLHPFSVSAETRWKASFSRCHFHRSTGSVQSINLHMEGQNERAKKWSQVGITNRLQHVWKLIAFRSLLSSSTHRVFFAHSPLGPY